MNAPLVAADRTVEQFTYAALPADVASEARSVAERIRNRQGSILEQIAESGQELLRMREKIERGQFLLWIEHECGLSKSAAYRYMDVAQRIGPLALPTLGSLPLPTVYKLASPSTPERARELVLGHPSVNFNTAASVERIIDEVKEEDRKAKEGAKLTEEQRRKGERRAKRERRSREQSEAELQRWKEQQEAKKNEALYAARKAADLVVRMAGNELCKLHELIVLLSTANIREFGYLLAKVAKVDIPREWDCGGSYEYRGGVLTRVEPKYNSLPTDKDFNDWHDERSGGQCINDAGEIPEFLKR